MFGKIREKLTFYLSTLVLLNASAFGGYVLAQDALEEIVVTARKKAESLQDVPLSVSALRESSLEELGVNVLKIIYSSFLASQLVELVQEQVLSTSEVLHPQPQTLQQQELVVWPQTYHFILMSNP